MTTEVILIPVRVYVPTFAEEVLQRVGTAAEEVRRQSAAAHCRFPVSREHSPRGPTRTLQHTTN